MAVTLPRLRTASLRAGTAWYRVYNATWGYDEHNPGYGDARFSPIHDPARVAAACRACTWPPPGRGVAETVFHDVHHAAGASSMTQPARHAARACARARGGEAGRSARPGTSTPGTAPRAGRLQRRRALSMHTPAGHRRARARRRIPRSDLAFAASRAGRPGPGRGDGALRGAAVLLAARQLAAFGPGASSLFDGPGRLLVDEVAESLSAVIELEA